MDLRSEIYKGDFLTLFHIGGGGDSHRFQVVFIITSARDAAEPQNLMTFPKIE